MQINYGYCYATNRYFANLYDVSIHTVSQWISHLEKLGYITVEIVTTENKQVQERRLFIKDIPYVSKNTYPYVQKNTYPMYENVQENNINNNNININNKESVSIYNNINNNKAEEKEKKNNLQNKLTKEKYMLIKYQWLKQNIMP